MSPLAGVSVRDALDSALVALRAAQVDSPRLDAELLLADALGVDRAALVMDPQRELDGSASRRFQEAVRRRVVEREPVAYLVGRKGFRHLELTVDRRVLVPRPETELLVEAGLALAQGARVADVGTGSGAVALALTHERPDLDVVATDASADALAVARDNAARLGLDVAFAEGDLLAAVEGPLDAVLSNPPYVAAGAAVMPEVRHEPEMALFAGGDGLDLLRRLVAQAADREVALLAVELGEGQAPAVQELARAAGFAQVEARRDLAGIERVVVGRR